MDLHITTGIQLFYKRYVDDMSMLAKSKGEAIRNCEQISEKDQDKRIKWEVEFPVMLTVVRHKYSAVTHSLFLSN